MCVQMVIFAIGLSPHKCSYINQNNLNYFCQTIPGKVYIIHPPLPYLAYFFKQEKKKPFGSFFLMSLEHQIFPHQQLNVAQEELLLLLCDI